VLKDGTKLGGIIPRAFDATYRPTHLVTHLVWPHGGPISMRPRL